MFDREFSLSVESVEGFRECMKQVEEQVGGQKIFIIGLQIAILGNLDKMEKGLAAYL